MPKTDSDATPVRNALARRLSDSAGPASPPGEVPAWLNEGRYVFRREIATGGMGRVFLVYDQELERDVALKILLPTACTQPVFLACFVEEARVIGQLEHPGIMPVYDIGQAPDGLLYFTMKYVEGQTLETVIDRLFTGDAEAHARWPFSARLRVIADLAGTLAFAHARGVLHRDIKPSNVMIGPFGEVTLMDWGLALRTLREGEVHNHATPIARLAQEGGGEELSAGTPGYMAPEVLTCPEHYDARSDIYSLGALMYELFTLGRPFPDSSGIDIVLRAAEEDPVPADEVHVADQGRVPKEVSNMIRQAMSRAPADRYKNTQELGQAIQAYQSGRAPVVCVHTGLKRFIYSLARLVDEHGHLVIVVLTILAAMPLLLALLWWLLWPH